jgi:hypothetical protein
LEVGGSTSTVRWWRRSQGAVAEIGGPVRVATPAQVELTALDAAGAAVAGNRTGDLTSVSAGRE